MEANQKFTTSRPRKGNPVTYCERPHGTVSNVEGNLCWTTESTAGPFIWCFQDGLNLLHDWPSKAPNAQHVGDDWPPESRAEFLRNAGVTP